MPDFTYGIGVDPGPENSGALIVNVDEMSLMFAQYCENNALLRSIRQNEFLCVYGKPRFIAIERIVSYGMPVGNGTFLTAEWAGRFREAAEGCSDNGGYDHVEMISRPDIKVALCGGTTFMSDKNARKKVTPGMLKTVVKDKFEQTGGGKNPAIGTKKQPGPLFSFPSIAEGGEHCWAAMCVLFGALETIGVK